MWRINTSDLKLSICEFEKFFDGAIIQGRNQAGGDKPYRQGCFVQCACHGEVIGNCAMPTLGNFQVGEGRSSYCGRSSPTEVPIGAITYSRSDRGVPRRA